MLLELSLVSLLAVTQGAFVKPWFCHRLDCPEFTVLKNNTDFQLRHYSPSKWVATNITFQAGVYGRKDNGQLFQRLFQYISGNNVPGEKVTMTAPVVTTVMSDTKSGQTTYVMHFMIPHDKMANTPVPSATNVYLVDVPAMDVYVRSFGGFAGELTFETQLQELEVSLKRNSLNHDSSHFFTAGYDSPFTFTKRHNEVWMEASSS